MKYEQSMKFLDPQNIYLIKKLANSLTYDFEQALGKKNINEAIRVRNCVSELFTKIRTNKLWARKVSDLMIIMARKIKKQGLK